MMTWFHCFPSHVIQNGVLYRLTIEQVVNIRDTTRLFYHAQVFDDRRW